MISNTQILAPRLDYRPVEERIKDFDEACLGGHSHQSHLFYRYR